MDDRDTPMTSSAAANVFQPWTALARQAPFETDALAALHATFEFRFASHWADTRSLLFRPLSLMKRPG